MCHEKEYSLYQCVWKWSRDIRGQFSNYQSAIENIVDAPMFIDTIDLTRRFSIFFHFYLLRYSQLKILGGAPEEYRGERWATGDYSGRIGEEAHSSICPLKLPDEIITGDLWWELLRGPQWSHRRLEERNLRWAAIEIKRTFRRRPHGGPPVMRLSTPPLPTIFPLSAPDYFQ